MVIENGGKLIFKDYGADNQSRLTLRAKSIELTAYLEGLIEHLQHPDISIITPKKTNERGCQLSIKVKNANKTSTWYFFICYNFC